MSRSGANIKIEPVKVWLANHYQACVTLPNEEDADLGGKYFTITDGTNDWYVWYDVGNTDTDPAPGGTEIEVNISAGATASQVVTATVSAINAITGLRAKVLPASSSGLVIKVLGYDFPSAAVGTGTIAADMSVVNASSSFLHDLGFSDGDIELTMDQQLVDVTAHQSGAEIIAAIVNGMNVEMSLALKEVTQTNKDKIIGEISGSEYTVGANDFLGYGSGQNFRNVLNYSTRLILHPVSIANNVYTSDLCCPLSYPKLDSFLFSGENPQMMNMTFRVFRDDFMDSSVDKVFLGDHTKI
jgi:hypothetical protein